MQPAAASAGGDQSIQMHIEPDCGSVDTPANLFANLRGGKQAGQIFLVTICICFLFFILEKCKQMIFFSFLSYS